MKAILIGGPCDHQVKDILYDCTYISIPVRESVSLIDLNFPNWEEMPNQMPSVTLHQYLKDCISFDNDKLFFFRHESLSSQEALMAVLNYYVKPMRPL